MYINYIILAHKNPLQVKRLIEKLHESWTYIYIHIDRNIDIMSFKKVLTGFENVIFLENEERHPGIWGDIGIVKGTLAAMLKIITDGRKGYTILLSGQDYPLTNNKAILEFFENNNTNFIDTIRVETLWKNQGRDRISKYKINKSSKRGHFLLLPSIYERDFYKWITLGKLNFLRKSKRLNESKIIFRKRNFPSGLVPFGGSVYWALPMKTIRKILVYIENNPEYIKYHKYTLCADEIFFHSIIANFSKEKQFKIEPSLTYANWLRSSGPLPVTFKIKDFEELKIASSNFLFARKFHIILDKEILDKCDKKLLK